MLKHLFEPLTLSSLSWGEGRHSTLQHLGRGIDHRRRFCEALWKIHLGGQNGLTNCCWDWVFLGEKWTFHELPGLYHFCCRVHLFFYLMPWVCCNDQRQAFGMMFWCFLVVHGEQWKHYLLRVWALASSFCLIRGDPCKIDSTHNMSIFNLQGFISDGQVRFYPLPQCCQWQMSRFTSGSLSLGGLGKCGGWSGDDGQVPATGTWQVKIYCSNSTLVLDGSGWSTYLPPRPNGHVL